MIMQPNQRPALGWIKIGILIGIGFLIAQILWPLGIVALVASPLLLGAFAVALFYTRLRDWWIVRISLARRNRRRA